MVSGDRIDVGGCILDRVEEHARRKKIGINFFGVLLTRTPFLLTPK
jgi:hypothetical protein